MDNDERLLGPTASNVLKRWRSQPFMLPYMTANEMLTMSTDDCESLPVIWKADQDGAHAGKGGH